MLLAWLWLWLAFVADRSLPSSLSLLSLSLSLSLVCEQADRSVSVKVLHNDKDCVDQGLGEVRLLTLLAERDPTGEVPLVRLLNYFYYKEHLLIVTEVCAEQNARTEEPPVVQQTHMQSLPYL